LRNIIFKSYIQMSSNQDDQGNYVTSSGREVRKVG